MSASRSSWRRFIQPSAYRSLSTSNASSTESPAANESVQFNAEELAANEGFNSSKLRRALLYVPGNDQRKVDKVKSIADTVDSIVLDCEDGVAVNMKETARHTILDTLTKLSTEPNASLHERLSVRVNSVSSGLAEEDLNVILSGPVLPQTILLPKVDSKSDIDNVRNAEF